MIGFPHQIRSPKTVDPPRTDVPTSSTTIIPPSRALDPPFTTTTTAANANPAPLSTIPIPDDDEELGDEIARLAAHIHAATYRLLVLVHAMDERIDAAWGFRSTAHWLSWRTGVGIGAAREKVRVAKALPVLPLISGAMASGELSFSKVRALTRIARPENEDALLDVARHAPASKLEKLVQSWQLMDRLEDADGERQRHESRFLHLNPDDDGSYVIRGRLDPEVGALLEEALEWAVEGLFREEQGKESAGDPPAATSPTPSPTFAQRRADALGLVAELAFAASGEADGGVHAGLVSAEADNRPATMPHSRADRFQVVVHVQAADLLGEPGPGGSRDRSGSRGLDGRNGSTGPPHPMPPMVNVPTENVPAETWEAGETDKVPTENVPAETSEDGNGVPSPLQAHRPHTPHIATRTGPLPISIETVRRLTSDAGLLVMAHDEEGGVLDVGRKRRTIPPAIRRALEYRDQGCRFPGCGCRYTEGHHIVHWKDGGETKLDNLVSLCSRHHRAVHQEGYRIEVVRREIGDGGPALAFRFYDPRGREVREVPQSPVLPPDPAGALVRNHTEAGIVPGGWTATPDWHGEPLDYHLAIDMLWGDFGAGGGGR